MKGRVHQYPQQFFSVARFLEMVQHNFAQDQHDPKACTLNMRGSYYRTDLIYRLLREDVLVFDQLLHFKEAEYSCVSSDPDGDYYLFKYVYQVNMPLRIENKSGILSMSNGFLSISNNCGNHNLWIPADFNGKILQILIERSFLEEFIQLDSFRATLLRDVLFNKSEEMLYIDYAPQFLRRRLAKLAKLLYLPADRTFDKLNMLTAVAEVLECFLGLYMSERRIESIDTISDASLAVDNIAVYLSSNLYLPFPGMDYLAKYFGVSLSTLKRHFSVKYNSTPHAYFRSLQMEEAKKLLEDTQLPIAEIGYKMGFDSPGNFTRVFKGKYGVCPTFYR